MSAIHDSPVRILESAYQQVKPHKEMRNIGQRNDYLGGISGNTELNWQDLLDYKKDLLAFCDKNPTLGLLEAARRAAVE